MAVVEEMIEHHDKELRIVEAEEKAEAERKRIEQEVIDCWDMDHEMNAMVDQQSELDRQAAEQARIAEEQAAEQRRLQIEAEKKEAAEKAAEEARLAEQARAARAIEEAKQREQAAMEENRRLASEARKKANDALLKGLAQQQENLQADARQLVRLQTAAQSADGQLAAIGYANQLASNQSNQLLQIRSLLITQQNAVASQMQAEADLEAQYQASRERLFDMGSPTDRSKNKGF